MARDGRRRRVLNDEARSALTTYPGAGSQSERDADAPRYGELASIEHHPQITDYIPRRKRAILVTLGAGFGVAAVAQALAHFAVPIAGAIPGASAAVIGEQLAGGLVAWSSTVALLASAVLARIVFSLRRHRVGDVRGRYRVWQWVGWGATLGSINAVVGIHAIVASAATALTGWSLTSGGAEWWIVPSVIVGGWIAVRLLLEVAESRGAATTLTLSMTCYAAAAAGTLGWAPAALNSWADVLVRSLPLVGHTLALVGLTLFGRYVVLDVQGLIDHSPRQAAAKSRQAAQPEFASAPAAANNSRPVIVAKITPASAHNADEDEWSDEGVAAQDVRHLSKSERKRLRKQGRAA